MRLNILIFFTCAAAAVPAGALISASGPYQLESSVCDNGGGELVSGGAYSSRGSIGQNIPGGRGNSAAGEYVNRSGFYDPPHFTFQKGLVTVVNFNSGTASLSLPAGAVGKEVFDITLNNNPSAQSPNIDAANNKMVNNEGAWSQLFSNNLSEMSIFDEQEFYTKPLLSRGILNMRYRDDNDDGILDGSSPPVRVDSLSAWGLDETFNSWVQLPGAGVDRDTKILTSYFDQSGVYALLGSLVQAIPNSFKAFPAPFRPYGPQAGNGAGQTGTEAGGITFEGVPQTGKIEIYALDGRLVRRLGIPDNLTFPYRVIWDVRTTSGARAASGVYLWRVVSGSNSKTGKLMVIW